MSIAVREATNEDAESLTRLINELGYTTTVPEMTVRFNNILRQANYKTLLACIDGVICGMVGASHNYLYEKNGTYVRIVALVTDSRFRKRGVAKALLNAVEDWAKDNGATLILLNCGNRPERAAAHLFYANNGFTAKSTGYAKRL